MKFCLYPLSRCFTFVCRSSGGLLVQNCDIQIGLDTVQSSASSEGRFIKQKNAKFDSREDLFLIYIVDIDVHNLLCHARWQLNDCLRSIITE